MSRFVTRAPRAAALVIAVATAVSLTGVGVAQATTTPAAKHVTPKAVGSSPAKGQSSVTIQLKPQNRSALLNLGRAKGLSGTARKAALTAAAPTAGAAATVKNYLAGQGLTVTASTPFSVTANGSAATIARLFPETNPAHPTASSSAKPMTALSATESSHAIPTAIAGVASYVVGGASTGPLVHPMSSTSVLSAATSQTATSPISGSDARTLYDVPASALTNNPDNITVATLQFSGWNDADLTTFAASNSLADPVASGQYAATSVDGADSTASDGNGGQVEVALDQESLLTTAPQALQSAYFAPNSTQGFIDGIEQVANDAYTHAGGRNVTALSISWGECEAAWTADDMNAVDSAIADAESVGVTVFAASGDEGAFACNGDPSLNDISPDVLASTLAVNYPASDPLVVAVGGLNTNTSTGLESAWWNSSSATGTGGGGSWYWGIDSWQSSRIAGEAVRLVPDIATDGAPETGMLIVSGGSTGLVGGTSLSSPLAAATLADDQIAQGAQYTWGDGLITPNLYAAPATGFRDTVHGSNGYYAAKPGYDLASGLGAPRWDALLASVMTPLLLTDGKITSATLPATVPLYTQVPEGGEFVGYAAGVVGRDPIPTSCTSSPPSTTPPASVSVPGYGAWTVWMASYDYTGVCHVAKAAVSVYDGVINDVVSRDTSGRLWLYPGNGLGQFSSRTLIGSGWNVFTAIIGVGDFNGDGHPDLVTRDTSGRLWMYPGNGTGGFKSRVLIGTGWNVMSAIVSVGDFNGDGHNDFVTRDTSGRLWLYPGNGGGYFKTHVLIGVGWNSMNAIVGVGDFNGDHHADFVTRDTAGRLWLYPGNGGGAFKTHVEIGTGWSGYTSMVGPGDFNGDARTDLLARDSSGGLWLDEGNGAGGIHSRVKIGTGWNTFTSIVGVGNWKS